MTVQTILRFPDHHLRATAQRVVVFDEDLCSLATDLLDTLRAASAIGITATHIGFHALWWRVLKAEAANRADDELPGRKTRSMSPKMVPGESTDKWERKIGI